FSKRSQSSHWKFAVMGWSYCKSGLLWQGRSVMESNRKQSMNILNSNSPLSPEEFQRQLSEFVRQHFQSKTQSAEPAAKEESGPEQRQSDLGQFEFSYKPKDVKAFLDRYVI